MHKKRKKILVRIISRKKGGALGDYLSYVPGYQTASSYAQSAYDTYNTAKNAYDLYKDVVSPVEPPPPLPSSEAPPLTKAEKRHNDRILDQINLNNKPKPEKKSSIITKLKQIQPLGQIDRALGILGYREPIRGAISKASLGKTLLKGVDGLIKAGFGVYSLMNGGRRRKRKQTSRRKTRKTSRGGRVVLMIKR